MRKTLTITVEIECAEETNPAVAQQMLDSYCFKYEGLVEIDAKLKKKDWAMKQIASKFLIQKSNG